MRCTYGERMDLELAPETTASGGVVLTMAGALDLESRGRLLSESFQQLSAGPTRFELDMAGVDFIDSTGIGAIVEVAQRAEELGIEFAIRRPSPRVVRILKVTGLSDQWRLTDDVS